MHGVGECAAFKNQVAEENFKMIMLKVPFKISPGATVLQV